MHQTLIAVCLAIAAYAGPAYSCGYHDSTLLAQGFLNQLYPNSLHVTGAIMRARRAGHLPPFDQTRLFARGEERKALDRQAFADTMAAVHALAVAIEQRSARRARPGISMVVIDTMLWTRFSGEFFDVRQGLHQDGPVAGDIVLITDEPVVQSIRDGSLTIARAVELGVIRIYADEQARNTLLDRFGSIGEAPLESRGTSPVAQLVQLLIARGHLRGGQPLGERPRAARRRVKKRLLTHPAPSRTSPHHPNAHQKRAARVRAGPRER